MNYSLLTKGWPGLIEAYREWLPVTEKTPVVTLQEGATPLIPINAIADRIGKNVKVYAKYDGLNPTVIQRQRNDYGNKQSKRRRL